jgi:A/G-specific adenine glycosylase
MATGNDRETRAAMESSTEQEIAAFRDSLAGWYRSAGRNLPWRDDRSDPYRVVVSEMMLVQTTVAAVVPYYHRFLERFPTIRALAEADEADVLKQWEGLGYYRRARQLQQFARSVVSLHDGSIPNDQRALMDLPGIGRYIAGAVRSFSFDEPAPILEANTIRLLARLIGLREVVTTPSSQKRLWAVAEKLVPLNAPGAFNQALMDLGATVCTPRSPNCPACPVSKFCASCRDDLVSLIPTRLPRRPPQPGEELTLLLEHPSDGSIYLTQRSDVGLWANFWEPPTFWVSGADPAQRASAGFASENSAGSAVDMVRSRLGVGIRPDALKEIGTFGYTVTRYAMRLHVIRAIVDLDSEAIATTMHSESAEGFRFVPREAIGALTLSSVHRKALRQFMK